MPLEQFLHWFLPIYGLFFFFTCIVWRGILVWKQTGINPIHWSNPETAHGYVAAALRWHLWPSALCIILFSFMPEHYPFLLPISWLGAPALQRIGTILLLASFAWTALAQAQMGASWRIGVDRKNRTELVSEGLFRFSRNPIYLGILASSVGFFLVMPNAVTLLLMTNTYFLIQIEVRLEEDHMRSLHRESYEAFCKKVKRWI